MILIDSVLGSFFCKDFKHLLSKKEMKHQTQTFYRTINFISHRLKHIEVKSLENRILFLFYYVYIYLSKFLLDIFHHFDKDIKDHNFNTSLNNVEHVQALQA